MNFQFETTTDEIIFRITDYNKKYLPVFQQCFWQEENDSYFKKFPLSCKHLELIKQTFTDNAEEMFSQLGYFSPVKWEDALYDFAKVMNASNINWWLTGSCAACIRGIKLSPHDVDIIVDGKDIDKIADLFSDKLIIPVFDTQGWVTKHFGVIFWHARIDIASDPVEDLDKPEPIDCGPYAKARLEEVEWKGQIIKVPPIELTLAANIRRKRHDHVKIISEYISQNN